PSLPVPPLTMTYLSLPRWNNSSALSGRARRRAEGVPSGMTWEPSTMPTSLSLTLSIKPSSKMANHQCKRHHRPHQQDDAGRSQDLLLLQDNGVWLASAYLFCSPSAADTASRTLPHWNRDKLRSVAR